MIGSIDKNVNPEPPKIYLCKPNREKIALISEHLNARATFKFNDVHDYSIDIPYKINQFGKIKDNPVIDKIRGRYLLEIDGEHYIIDKFEKRSQDGKNILRVSAKHQIYELRDKDVRGLEGVMDLQQAMDKTLLADTNWTIDYIDPDFLLTNRQFDVTSESLLQFIFNSIKKFRAIIYYSSKNRTISFYREDEFKMDRGLQVNERKYLESINDTVDMETVCTRLRAYGEDGMSIHEHNPTGQNFVENFSYFLYPYEEDSDGNVLKSSFWLSDELCHAIKSYSDHVQSLEGVFKDILSDLMDEYSTLSELNTELFELESDLLIIQDALDLANLNDNYTGDLVEEKNDKLEEIGIVEDQIEDVELEIESLDSQIDDLRESLQVYNHYMDIYDGDEELVKKIIDEKRDFEIYRTFDNSSYFDMEELYEVAQEEIIKYVMPPINIDMSLVNFLNLSEGANDWERIGVGYIMYLSYKDFDLKVKSMITEIEIDYERNNINLRIADMKRLTTDEDYINEMLYRNTSASNKVDANKKWWDAAEEDSSTVRKWLEEGWDANLQQINAGVGSEVTINRRGILIKSPEEEMNYLVARHGILAITNDGGNTFKNAITKDGIVGQRITGQILAGTELTIGNEGGGVEINKDGMFIDKDIFLIGESISEYDLYWDGSDLWIDGNIIVRGGEIRGNLQIGSSTGIRSAQSATTPVIYSGAQSHASMDINESRFQVYLNGTLLAGSNGETPQVAGGFNEDFRGFFVPPQMSSDGGDPFDGVYAVGGPPNSLSARWKFNNGSYLRQDDEEFRVYFAGEGTNFSVLKNGDVRVKGNTIDYIEEEGSNSDGYYQKFSDGTMVVYGEVRVNFNTSDIQSYSFPETFVDDPAISISASQESIIGGSGYNDRLDFFNAITPRGRTTGMHLRSNKPTGTFETYDVGFKATGRWK